MLLRAKTGKAKPAIQYKILHSRERC